MNVKVVKFGGSSLADAKQITKAADIIKSDVVPSAPGKRFSDDIKVTDMLYNCNKLAMENQSIDAAFTAIADRYNGIIKDLGLDLSLDSEFEVIKSQFVEQAGKDYAASLQRQEASMPQAVANI